MYISMNFSDTDSDESLVFFANEGHSRAIDLLTARYLPYAKKIAACFTPQTIGRQDLVQIGLLSFLSAVTTFRTDMHSSFATYAGTCMQNAMISALRKDSKNAVASSLADCAHLTSTIDVQQQVEDAMTGTGFLEKLFPVLTAWERQVLLLSMEGHSVSEIQEATGRDAKSIYNALQRARAKARKCL